MQAQFKPFFSHSSGMVTALFSTGILGMVVSSIKEKRLFEERTMSEAAEILMDGILNAWNSKNWEQLKAFHMESWIDHTSPAGMNDLAALEGMFNVFTSAFPDLELEIPKAVVDGDEVAYVYLLSGTHNGDFMGIPPSGREVNIKGMTMLTMEDGKCGQAWGVLDIMALMQQIGAVPVPEV